MSRTNVNTGNTTGFADGTGIETFAAADGGLGGYSAIVDPADTTKPLKPEAVQNRATVGWLTPVCAAISGNDKLIT